MRVRHASVGHAPVGKATVVDYREPRVIAAITAAVMLLALALGPEIGLALLAMQTLTFAFGAILGLRYHPYAALYRGLIAPRVSPTARSVAESPIRLGQALGMTISVIAILAGTVGLTGVSVALTWVVVLAALGQTLFGACVGCLLYRRLAAAVAPPTVVDLTDDTARRSLRPRRTHDLRVS